MAERESLRLITSEAELRVGILVEVRRGQHPGRYLLLSPVQALCGEVICTGNASWKMAPEPATPGKKIGCLCTAIYFRVAYEVRPFQDDEADREDARKRDENEAAKRAAWDKHFADRERRGAR